MLLARLPPDCRAVEIRVKSVIVEGLKIHSRNLLSPSDYCGFPNTPNLFHSIRQNIHTYTETTVEYSYTTISVLLESSGAEL